MAFLFLTPTSETKILTERAFTKTEPESRAGQVTTHPFSTMLLFQNRWWPEEALLTIKLRKHRGKEGRREEKIEAERGIINDVEIEFVMEVFISFLYCEKQRM